MYFYICSTFIYSQFHISPSKKLTQYLCSCPCAYYKISVAIVTIFLLSLIVLSLRANMWIFHFSIIILFLLDTD